MGLAVLVAVTLAACAASPPVQEMSDARQAIAAAREAGAESYDPQGLQAAEAKLATAESDLQKRDYHSAARAAAAAKNAALDALLRSRTRRDAAGASGAAPGSATAPSPAASPAP